MYTNLDGLGNKVAELSNIIRKEDPDLVFLTETKADGDMLDMNLFDTKEYIAARKDRKNQRAPGGGVTILTRKNLVIDKDSVNFLVQHEAEETTWCEVKCEGGKDILLGVVYRTPSSPAINNDKICNIVRESEEYTQGKQVLVCGDFNFGNILWEENKVQEGSQGSSQANNFLEAVQDAFWTQHVNEWTHMRDTDNPSRLDLIFTKKECEIEDIKYAAPLGLSKHAVMTFTFIAETTARQQEDKIVKLNYHKADLRKMRQLLREVKWEELFNGKSPQEKWNIFKEIYHRITKECIPTYAQIQRKRRPKWMTRRAMNAIDKKEAAWQRYRARKTPLRRQLYNAARNKASEEARKAKYSYEVQVATDAKDNPKHFWGYVRSKTSVKERVPNMRKTDGSLTQSDEESAQTMNEAFNDVFIEEEEEPPTLDQNRNYRGQEIGGIHISVERVKKKLEALNSDKSPGPDGISPYVLKKCAGLLSVPLTDIFRQSLSTGEVPEDWRRANITPIHKKGNKSAALNYRPVSLTSVVSKVMEGFIREELIAHVNSNEILCNAQHGFRSRRSCLTNMLTYLDDIINAVDNQNWVDAIYLDCEKAFDRVPHKRLMMKLEQIGITGSVKQWIASFLANRTHRVAIRGSYSEWLPVKSGVPQGSVVGPILFIIYINDLVNNLESPSSLFADDAKIYRTIKTQEDTEALQRDMDRVKDWSRKWLLTFNIEKCKVMHFGYGNPRNDYKLGESDLEKSALEKDLGVYVSADLKSSAHVAKVAAKANSRLGIIKRNFEYLDREIMLPLYKALVRPILDYASQCWSPYLIKDTKMLEQVQRRATRLVPECANLPYEERCKILGLQTLENRRRRGDMIEVYKLAHGYEDIPFTKFFNFSTTGLRGHRLKLAVPDHWRTALKGNWFPIRTLHEWNNLPENIVTAPTISQFKNRYDKHVGV